jgi:hypothetical protein
MSFLLKTPNTHSGKEITRGKHGVRSRSESGSAGLLVRRAGVSGRFILTCGHVLHAASNGADENVVYSPNLSECCGCECSRPIGDVVAETLPATDRSDIQARIELNGNWFAVDASLIALHPQTRASNEVPKIGKIVDKLDLISFWSLAAHLPDPPPALRPEQQVAVRKFGGRTGLTKGKVTGLRYVNVLIGGATERALVFEIDALPGQEPTVDEYPLDMEKFTNSPDGFTDPRQITALFTNPAVTARVGGTATKPTLIVTGTNFSKPGDSGAPIVDDNLKIVGILARGDVVPIYTTEQSDPVDVFKGKSLGIFIRAAMEKWNVELMPPGDVTAGRPVAVPGAAITRQPRGRTDPAAVRAAWAAVEHTPLGARLDTLGHRHLDEVVRLVNHNRRVMVTWHRHGGPGFVNTVLRAADRPGWPLPAAVGGKTLVDLLRTMRDVLVAEGSASLRNAITENEEWILDLAARASCVGDIAGRCDPAGPPTVAPVPLPGRPTVAPGPPTVAPLPPTVAPGPPTDRPGPPMVRIVNSRGVPGVAGALVRDASGTPCLLSNHHVVFGRGAVAGDDVWAVPPEAGGGAPVGMVRLGAAGRGRIGRVGSADDPSFVDGVLIELDRAEDHPGWLRAALTGAWPTSSAHPVPGTPVVKHGPATGTTEGVVLDAAYPDHPFIEGKEWVAPGQILVGSRDTRVNFSAAGDSGAALLDEQHRIVGLLWGSTGGGEGVACPIAPLLDCLGVTLAAPRELAAADLAPACLAEAGNG